MTIELLSKQFGAYKFGRNKMSRLAQYCVLGICVLFPASTFAASVVVLDFELKDLTLNPSVKEETERTATLRPLLVERLVSHHKIDVIENPASAKTESQKGTGYLFDRPNIAGKIGQEVGAEWVVSGRLHKASFLFVYLKAQLIDARTGGVAADFVVEIKGPQKKLTIKGIESLALQVNDAIAHLDAAKK